MTPYKKDHQQVLSTSSFLRCLQISYFHLGLQNKVKLHALSIKFRLISTENAIQTNTNNAIDEESPLHLRRTNIHLLISRIIYRLPSAKKLKTVQLITESNFEKQRKRMTV